MDFAVSPEYQGRGISSLLYKSLFSNINHKTAILYTHQSETAAYNIYLKKGWEVLRNDLVFKSGKKIRPDGKANKLKKEKICSQSFIIST